jgi:hypothetical protein
MFSNSEAIMIEDYIKEKKKDLFELKTSPYTVIEGKGKALRILGVPFGGHKNGKDEDGEYFSPRTNIALRVGDSVPVYYNHGLTPRGTRILNPEPLTWAKYTGVDGKGHWFDVDDMPDDVPLGKRIINAVTNGLGKASSGAINYLVRKVQETGEILNWPVGDLSVIDQGPGRQPANQLATVALKSAFDNAGIEFPEAFLKSGELERNAANEDEGDNLKILNKETIMSDEEKDTNAHDMVAAKSTSIDVDSIVTQKLAEYEAKN